MLAKNHKMPSHPRESVPVRPKTFGEFYSARTNDLNENVVDAFFVCVLDLGSGCTAICCVQKRLLFPVPLFSEVRMVN